MKPKIVLLVALGAAIATNKNEAFRVEALKHVYYNVGLYRNMY